MIKNLLYSLFLHFAFITFIYYNFNIKKTDPVKTKEIAVSLSSSFAKKKPQTTNSEVTTSSKKKTEKKEDKKIEEKKEKVKTETKKKKKEKAKPKPKKKKAVKKQPKKEIKKKAKKPETQKTEKTKKEEDKPKKEELIGPTPPEKKDKEKEKKPPIQNNIINLSEEEDINKINLSAREIFNINNQLKHCYRRAKNESKTTSKLQVIIKITIDKEGYIKSNLDEMVDMEFYNNNEDYKNAIDNVRRALNLCSPLRNLPDDKYDVWKKVILKFDEN